MNILSNAIDAIEEYRLTETANARQPTIRIITQLTVDKRVVIRITDNGPGIPNGVHLKLFDPFFTTKPVGKGTGLGLSISYQIITEKHQGRLQCISTLSEGAEFIIEIPLHQKKASFTLSD